MTLAIDPATSSAPQVLVRPLDWDTSFFGARMGVLDVAAGARLEGLPSALQDALSRASRDGFDHLILRCDAGDWDVVWAAEAAGLRLVDVGVDLRCRELPHQAQPEAHACRPWAPSDLDELRQIAADSFVFSRFSVDPFFTETDVRRFHATWITNLCHGLADEVLVLGDVGVPVGFVSCTGRAGAPRIPLIAVRENARGRGVGDQLMTAAKEWFARHGSAVAWVKTQAQNHRALALYSRHGFTPARSELVFSIQLGHRYGTRGGRP